MANGDSGTNQFHTQSTKTIMYKLLTIGFLSFAMQAIGSAGFAQDPNFHIYLCFGQSNMEGSAKIETQDKNSSDRFLLLQSTDSWIPPRKKGQWVTAKPPLCRQGTGLGPAHSFGNTMIKHLPENIKVGIVHVAVGGCRIELFDKNQYQDFKKTHEGAWFKKIINQYGGNPYRHLLQLAKKAQESGVIKGILLHQGESNTGDEQWPAKVKVIYDDLSKGCTVQPDKTHFDSHGVRLLGKRYAHKMLETMGIKFDEKGQAVPTPALPAREAEKVPD